MQGKNDLTSFEQFCKKIELDLQNQLSYLNATAELRVITKNNNQKHKVLVISETGCKITPNIYLKQFYDMYLSGKELALVEHLIVKQYADNVGFEFNATDFTDWNNVCKRIAYKLVNYEENKEMLETIPHRRFLDLAVTYYCIFDDMADNEYLCATAQITNEHLKVWHKTEADLYQKASENTFILIPYMFTGIENAINECIESGSLIENDNLSFMYVLTNERKLFGSATILYDHLLQTISERTFLGADLYILPSSIHELIILPVIKGSDFTELADMVRKVNESEVAPHEFLSENVYYYSRETDEISICMG